MKKLYYIFSILLGLTLYSCDDFLSKTSPDELTSGSFWRNLDDAEAGISAAYSQLEYSIDTWAFAEVRWPVEAYREDLVELGSDAMNYLNWVELSNFNYTNGNSQVSSYWWNNYEGASFSSQVIDKVPTIPEGKISQDLRAQIINEAHFLRGYYHLKLILNWDQIIIRDTYITSQADLSKALSTRVDAWDFIINEFNKATKLPNSYDADNLGRATSGAAYAYLGLAYLTRAYEEPTEKQVFLQKALEAFQEVKGYELVRDFGSLFNGNDQNSKESVFELQFSKVTANGAWYQTQAHKWLAVSELGGWDEILPSQFLVDEFMKEGEISNSGGYDKRLYHTIFCDIPYFNDGSGKVYGANYNDWFSGGKIAFHKLLPATKEQLFENYIANNIPLMRYANVLLMQAEALNELGQTPQAISLINQVRDAHGDMPPMVGTSQEDVRKQIEHERIIEFPLENWRWYDLRRWGKLEAAMQAAQRPSFKMDKNAFYPIPLTELNANELLK
ncbi:RagB/SusD family nutrient uptake outer membrane protein [Bacteroides propionicifaciens]|uniref:RagB/SusD family nutrient uptake outer membrane protein n=1 Tax=Bacteroides propionicifaciens TaxID=392838 RepID=UPI0003776955|nr:RagB/SusD family nutrient uptake outer membrane protein [Bacteroides propionicifaciens]